MLLHSKSSRLTGLGLRNDEAPSESWLSRSLTTSDKRSYVTWGSVPQLVFRLARPGDPWAGRHPHPGLISAGPEAGRRSLNGLLAMKRRPAITASRCPRFPSKPECLEREPRSHHSWAVRSRAPIGSTWWIPSPTRQSPRVERSRSRVASAAASGSARAGCAGSRRQQLCIGPGLLRR